jgi:putative FmdB family regulatory protein
MPIYEYQCLACGRRHEAIQKLDEAPLAVCPDCGGALKKMVSSPAFQFKGTGWYATDYAAKKGGGADDEKGAKKSGDEGGGSEKGADSKPAEATTSAPEKKESAKPAESS